MCIRDSHAAVRGCAELVGIHQEAKALASLFLGKAQSLEHAVLQRDVYKRQGLDAIGLQHTVPQGAYYILMDISEFGFDSDLEFCEVLALSLIHISTGAICPARCCPAFCTACSATPGCAEAGTPACGG